MDKRMRWITIWGFVGGGFLAAGFLWLVSAAPKTSNLPHWPALPLFLAAAAGLYCMFAAGVAAPPHRGLRSEPPEPRPSPPDLPSAANAMVQALRTHGPARNSRLSKARLDLQRAAGSLGSNGRATIARTLARELADCTDPDLAVDLRDRLLKSL